MSPYQGCSYSYQGCSKEDGAMGPPGFKGETGNAGAEGPPALPVSP